MAFIYLNESSMQGNGSLGSQWSAVDKWFDLVKYLEDNYRIAKIGGPKHFYDYELCDYKLSLCFNPSDKSLDKDKRQLLLNLASYIESSIEADSYPIFVFDNGGESATSGEKIAYLRLHGRILAEMNGWRVDENKTKLNQSDDKQRLVFRSKNFKNEGYYLSIDFEKEDFHYELHDHNGVHLREINWQGIKTGEADKTHNLKMKKERKKK